MYNCTPAAGANRQHKHLRIIEKPEKDSHSVDKFRIFLDDKIPNPEDGPFLYFVEHIRQRDIERELPGIVLDRIYKSLLEKPRAALDVVSGADLCSHIVVLVKEWTMLIPRRSAPKGRRATCECKRRRHAGEWFECPPTFCGILRNNNGIATRKRSGGTDLKLTEMSQQKHTSFMGARVI